MIIVTLNIPFNYETTIIIIIIIIIMLIIIAGVKLTGQFAVQTIIAKSCLPVGPRYK